jgi:hypothetical protein
MNNIHEAIRDAALVLSEEQLPHHCIRTTPAIEAEWARCAERGSLGGYLPSVVERSGISLERVSYAWRASYTFITFLAALAAIRKTA